MVADVSVVRLRELLEYNPQTGDFYWRLSRGGAQKGMRAGSPSTSRGKTYIQILVDRHSFKAHRLAWLYVNGVWPKEIDHINGDSTDNRICNLRDVTHRQNGWNRRGSPNKSGYKGVSWRKSRGKWKARIRVNGRLMELGDYDCPETAHAAYVAAAKLHFGEYARTK